MIHTQLDTARDVARLASSHATSILLSKGRRRFPENRNRCLGEERRFGCGENPAIIMGASTSTEHKVPAEQREEETLAASTGALSMLQKSFSKLADPQSSAIPFDSLRVHSDNLSP